jgi:hypothetical protein
MKFSEIVSMATKHTESRGSKVLDYNAELWAAIHDFCLFHPWRWRRNSGTFTTLNDGTRIYDLSDPAVLNAPDLEIIEAVVWVPGDGTVQRLDPINDPIEQALELDSDTEGDPRAYFRKPGDDLKLVIAESPVNPNVIRVVWRSIPIAPTPIAAPVTDVVPLVPHYLHSTLEKQLELRILEYTIGDADPKYERAKEKADEQIAKAIAMEHT